MPVGKVTQVLLRGDSKFILVESSQSIDTGLPNVLELVVGVGRLDSVGRVESPISHDLTSCEERRRADRQ